MNAPDRATWLQARRSGIGGSDIAALLGQSPYRTPLALWAEKTGRAEDAPDAATQERMHWGTVLEDIVARHYADTNGRRVQRINTMLRHPQCDIALANIDRAVVLDGSRARWDADAGRVLGADRILEVKTAHALAQGRAEWGEPGTDEVPQAYYLQCLWYLGITGIEQADLAVLFGGQRYTEYRIALDAALFADLLEEARGWWDRHVLADVPPQPQSEDEARMLWHAHKPGSIKIVGADVAEACAELVRTKAQIAALESDEQALRDRITCAIGESEAITHMGRQLATWKANKPSEKTDWKAIAAELEPGADLIAAHTTTTPGARVLRLNTKEIA